jgi:toxin HigB-1
MIRNFKGKTAQDIFDGALSRASRKVPVDLHDKVRRLFDQINASTNIETLRVPPGNNLDKLKGNLRNYWSVRVNMKWRVIFKWENSEALDIDVLDYH